MSLLAEYELFDSALSFSGSLDDTKLFHIRKKTDICLNIEDAQILEDLVIMVKGNFARF